MNAWSYFFILTYLRCDNHQLYRSGDLVLGADLALVPARVPQDHVVDTEGDQVRDLGPRVERDKAVVRDEGLPVHREDVTVPLPQPGHRLVVEVVNLALEVGHPAHLGSEHQVYEGEQLQHLTLNWIDWGINNDGI